MKYFKVTKVKAIIAVVLMVSVLFGTSVKAQGNDNLLGDLQEYCQSVINNDSTLTGFTTTNDIIPLYSLSNELYAYLIPLLNQNSAIDGYIIVGVSKNYYELLTIGQGKNIVNLYNTIRTYESDNYNIIYNFPFTFYLSDGVNFYEICENITTDNYKTYGISKLSNADVQNYMLNNSYINMQEYLDMQNIENANKKLVSIGSLPTADISLSNWSDFLPINDGSTIYYGGYQDWLHSVDTGGAKQTQFIADRACGIAAASNATAYLGRFRGMEYSSLYSYQDLSITNFTRHMKELLLFVAPKIYGIPGVGTLSTGVKNWASAKGVNLSSYSSANTSSFSNIVGDISDGLRKDTPVLLITWNSSISNLSYHWVTITRLYSTIIGSTGRWFITTSNWGEKCTYSLNAWYEAGSLYQGILYFY